MIKTFHNQPNLVMLEITINIELVFTNPFTINKTGTKRKISKSLETVLKKSIKLSLHNTKTKLSHTCFFKNSRLNISKRNIKIFNMKIPSSIHITIG